MTTLRRTFLGLFGALLAAAVIGALPATAHQARDIDIVNAAKAAGSIGEQADGYLGVRVDSEVTAEIRAAMSRVNAGRAELYRQAAANTGVTAAAAGASSFTQRFGSIPAGQWYRDSSGSWIRK